MYEGYFGYKPKQPGCTWGFKEINELHQFYSADIILRTIEEVSDRIEYALDNIDFKNEFSMMKYVFAIIRNNIKEVNDRERRKKERLEVLEKKENHVEIFEETDYSNSIHISAANDLSAFLGGDDL